MARRRRRLGAWDRVKRVIRSSYVVLEVLDARSPDTTRCHKLEGFARRLHKSIVLVVNKTDLVDEADAKATQRRLATDLPCVLVSAKSGKGRNRLKAHLRPKAGSDIRVAVFGYPNVGKSSIINMLTRRGKARTSPEPGFTKGEQWIRMDENILLLDTPGVIPRDEAAVDLALLGAWDIDKLRDPVPVAWKLIEHLTAKHPAVIVHYGGDPSLSTHEVLEAIARSRGRLLQGGEPDVDEMAKILVRDWYRGRIAKIITDEDGD